MTTKATDLAELYRELPSVDELLRDPRLAELPSAAIRNAAREVLAEIREEIGSGALNGEALRDRVEQIPELIRARAESPASLRPVINATGVILHTNLGRAPLSAAALTRVSEIAGRYNTLEFDLETGERGKRDTHAQEALGRTFGKATETIVVNNCAAATLLALNGLAEGGEVIVSRGELVEIGGSFRVPEIMAKSGARLREIGTTNRTRIADYERAISVDTKLLMRVSRSNFEMSGFVEQPALAELVELGRRHRLPVLEDHGNGCLIDVHQPALHTVQQSLRDGVDVVAYSGDKLLGGPQCGLLSGKSEYIRRLRANPLFRALRVDKLTYATLEATLRAYCNEQYDAIPVMHMIRADADDIRRRADAFAERMPPEFDVDVVAGESAIGGGTPPSATVATWLLSIGHSRLSAQQLQIALRKSERPVIARISDDRVVLDLRTVFPDEEALLLAALKSINR